MRTFLVCFLTVFSTGAFPQNIGINVDGSAPNSQALLHVNTDALPTNGKRGYLGPVMTTIERDASFPFPVEGLEIYNIDIHCKQYYNGTVWVDNCESQGCPAGMVDFGIFCIEDTIRPLENLATAINICRNQVPTARLCNWSEWVSACLDGSIPSLGDNWEWSSSIPQSNNVTIVGGGNCFLATLANISTDHFFRCCRPKMQ